jgi:threonine aldolase
MRQAGFLAAAGTYALNHHIPLLALDHLRTTTIAETLAALPFVHQILPPATNILIFSVQNGWTATAFCQYLSQLDIHCLPISATQVRMVFHLDVTDAMVTVLVQTLQSMPTHC